MFRLNFSCLKISFIALFLFTVVLGCSNGKEYFDDFYFNIHKLEQGEISKKKLVLSYEKVSPEIKNILREKGNGTKINTLCRFFSQVEQSDLNRFGLEGIILQNDKHLLKVFLDSIEFSGNIYKDCVEPFNLKIRQYRS